MNKKREIRWWWGRGGGVGILGKGNHLSQVQTHAAHVCP